MDANLILELARLGEQEFDRIDLDDTVLTPYVKVESTCFAVISHVLIRFYVDL